MPSQPSPKLLHAVPKSPGLDRSALDSAAEAMRELQEEFNIYRKEKAENEKLLSAQLDKLRTEASDMRVQNARLASQVGGTWHG